MVCEEKRSLAERYRSAAEKFAHAVAELHSKTAVSRKAEYVEMRHASEQARTIMEQARRDLERRPAPRPRRAPEPVNGGVADHEALIAGLIRPARSHVVTVVDANSKLSQLGPHGRGTCRRHTGFQARASSASLCHPGTDQIGRKRRGDRRRFSQDHGLRARWPWRLSCR